MDEEQNNNFTYYNALSSEIFTLCLSGSMFYIMCMSDDYAWLRNAGSLLAGYSPFLTNWRHTIA
jgi:hypothetical protein